MRQIQTCQGPFWVWDQDQVGAVLEGGAFWDWQLRPIIEEAAALYPGSVAIDLGASFGWFTVFLASRFSHVYAVEAYPETCEILQRNLVERGIQNVTVINQVAYDRKARFSLATPEMLGWPVPTDLNQTPNPSSIAFVEDSQGLYTGEPIVWWIPNEKPVGFVKIDVQGADLRAAKGLGSIWQRQRPLGVFEYESGPSTWFGDHWSDYQAFWLAEGYTLEELPASNYAVYPEELQRG